MTVDAAIAGWVRAAEEHAPERLELLRPGLSDEEIDAFEEEISPWKVPESLRALWRWHGGAEKGGTLAIYERLLGPSETIESREYWRGAAEELSASIEGYGGILSPVPFFDFWLPFLGDWGNGYYFIELSEPRESESAVWLHMITQAGSIDFELSSVESLVRVGAEEMRRGVPRLADRDLEGIEGLDPVDYRAEGSVIFENPYNIDEWPQRWRDALDPETARTMRQRYLAAFS